jgi:hypothetical protein
MENFTKKAMVGLSILGGHEIDKIPFILAGDLDLERMSALFMAKYQGLKPSNEQALNTPEVLEHLGLIKDQLREGVQRIFDLAAEEDRKEVLAELRESNKPSELGTVAEIAAKYGISKSEVRRLKAANLLHTLVKNPDSD